ncbi:MAG: RCC1 domain-containing protein [Polyangiaceae bacterium]
MRDLAVPAVLGILCAGCSAGGGSASRPPPPPATASSSVDARTSLHCDPGFDVRARACARIAPRVSIADTQICAALLDGRVFCWGRDDGGQFLPWMKYGTYSPTPREIAGVSSAVDVAASAFEACAILRDGSVVCWGGPDMTPPRPIEGVTHATKLRAGYRHFCAIDGDAHVACWGDFGGAAVGGGDGARSMTRATVISGLDDAVDLAAASDVTCVLARDHRVRCFGRRSPFPELTTIPGLSPIERLLAADRGHLCGVGEDGGLHCFGEDDGPRGPRRPEDPKVRYDLPSDARAVAIGSTFVCALFGQGTVKCTSAELVGASRGKPDFEAPLTVELPGFRREDGEGPIDLVAARRSLCASYESGHVRCIGSNEEGQIGTGEAGTRFEPKVVAGVSNATRVVLTAYGGCASTPRGLYCWGFGSGDLTDANASLLAPIRLDAPTSAAWFGRDDFVSTFPLVVDETGKPWTFPPGYPEATPSSLLPIEGLSHIADMSGFSRFGGADSSDVRFAVTTSGEVLIVTTQHPEMTVDHYDAKPIPLQGIGAARAVRTRNSVACVVRRAGTVACWSIATPYLGPKTLNPDGVRPKLLEVADLEGVEDLSPALMGWTARKSDGSVVTFETETSEKQPYVKLSGPPRAQPAFASSSTLDGLVDLGALTTSGQCLYQGPQVQNYTYDPYVLPCEGVTGYSVTEGGCEVRANGDVACWGSNRRGRIGSGERTFVLEPVDAHLPAIPFAANPRSE